MKFMRTKNKLLVLLVMVMALMPITANAAPAENDTGGISQGVFQIQQDKLPNGDDGHYYIDLVEEVEEEESGGFMDSIQNFDPIGNSIQDAAAASMITFKTTIIDLAFLWNKYATGLMINIVQFAFDTSLINAFIGMIETVVAEISGIKNGNIVGGLFGNLLVFAVVAAAVVGVYKVVIQRKPLATFQVLAQTLAALVVALLIITNFGPIMKGANDMSSALSASMMAGGASMISGEKQNQDILKEEVGNSLWKEFIVRPYLVLQYGNDDIDGIGEERINELLALPKGEERQNYVLETEVQERGNVAMTTTELDDRMVFTVVYSLINAMVSLPVMMLALALLIFQVWFLLMAFLAPFVLIQACFPGQFPVLKRYAIELAYPLVCKVIVTAVAMMVFSLGFLIYSIPVPEALGMAQYFASAILQFILFSSLFFIRHRIAKIMGAGNRGPFDSIRGDLVGLRHSMDNAANKMGHVAKFAGAAAIGAATGGTSTIATKAVSMVAAGAANKNNGQTGSVKTNAAPPQQTMASMDMPEPPETSTPPDTQTKTRTTTVVHAEPETKEAPPQFETDTKLVKESQTGAAQPMATLDDYDFEIEMEKEKQADPRDVAPKEGGGNNG